ncbi:MAG: DUF11 domain-containing protein, partial [Sphingobacteriales bacterium]
KVDAVVSFSIDVKNLGPGDATGVRVDDLLEKGYRFVSSNASKGSYNVTTGVWSLGGLASGATEKLTVAASVVSSGSHVNTATVSGNEKDPDLSNNVSTVNPVIGAVQANLGVEKTASSMAPVIGSNVVFTIAASNQGPDQATNVQVTDLLPAGYSYVASTVTVGSYDLSTGVWAVGTMASGASATLTVTARVNPDGPYANTATISGTELDPVPGNNSSTVTPVPNAALVDLSILKTAPLTGTAMGEAFDYTIEVKNKGVNLATGVVATDVLPQGLIFVETQTSFGGANYSAATRTVSWNIGSLASGASASLTIKVKADAAGKISNTAVVASREQDSNPADNSSTVDKDILGLRIPNVITPDGDGRNDLFRPVIIGGTAKLIRFSIYDRWGNNVWTAPSNRPDEGWDGTFKGTDASVGTYFYTISIEPQWGNVQHLKGDLILVR